MPTKRALVVGPTFVDIVMAEMNRLPTPGEEIHVRQAAWAPGGYAISALALQQLGIETTLLTDIGTDELGAMLLSRLKSAGLNVNEVGASDRTNIAVSLNWSGDRSIISYTHPFSDPTRRVHELITHQIDLALLSARHPYARSIAAECFAQHVPIALSLSWHPEFLMSSALKQLFPYAHYLFANVPEALIVTEESNFLKALGSLAQMIPEVMVTRGAQGVVAMIEGEFFDVPAPPAIMVDATGAGDVFAATYLAAALRGIKPLNRLKYANRAAAHAIEAVGSITNDLNWPALQSQGLGREDA